MKSRRPRWFGSVKGVEQQIESKELQNGDWIEADRKPVLVCRVCK